MKTIILQLNALETILLCITLVSFFFNVFQLMIWWRDKKTLHRPVWNALLALFNDIKAKSTDVFAAERDLRSVDNPHTDIETLRWDLCQTLRSIQGYLYGFQEAVVGVLVSVNPKDKVGQEAFRASDYGLTEEEKEFKRQNLMRLRAKEKAVD